MFTALAFYLFFRVILLSSPPLKRPFHPRRVVGIKQQREKRNWKERETSTVSGRIKTENYFFFVPFGLKLIFTVLGGCGEGEGGVNSPHSPGPPASVYSFDTSKKGEKAAPWRVPDEWDFCFLFPLLLRTTPPPTTPTTHALERSDDFKCKWGNKISVFILFPHRFSLSCSALPSPSLLCVFSSISALPSLAPALTPSPPLPLPSPESERIK